MTDVIDLGKQVALASRCGDYFLRMGCRQVPGSPAMTLCLLTAYEFYHFARDEKGTRLLSTVPFKKEKILEIEPELLDFTDRFTEYLIRTYSERDLASFHDVMSHEIDRPDLLESAIYVRKHAYPN